MYYYPSSYEDNMFLIGPSTSTDPEDGSWDQIADGAVMYSSETNQNWVQGPVLYIGPWAGGQVRIAFHYTGTEAEKWYVEDLCIGYGDDGEVPDTCDVQAGFDLASPPALPDGWLSVNGASNEDTAHAWRTSYDQYVSSPTSAVIDPSTGGAFSDKYLVSPIISLPGFD
jgi:hypothetical protein